jgi:hypothetical protein
MVTSESRVTVKGQVTLPADVQHLIESKSAGGPHLMHEVEMSLTIENSNNLFDRTSGLFAAYRRFPAMRVEEERAAYERSVAEHVIDPMTP